MKIIVRGVPYDRVPPAIPSSPLGRGANGVGGPPAPTRRHLRIRHGGSRIGFFPLRKAPSAHGARCFLLCWRTVPVLSGSRVYNRRQRSPDERLVRGQELVSLPAERVLEFLAAGGTSLRSSPACLADCHFAKHLLSREAGPLSFSPTLHRKQMCLCATTPVPGLRGGALLAAPFRRRARTSR